MEWKFDLLDLLEELGRVNLVDELSLLVISILHLEGKNGKHKELLFRVSSQVDWLLLLLSRFFSCNSW